MGLADESGVRLARMPIDEAKALRRAFGDSKYGHWRGVNMMGEAYIEAIDQLNYLDIARNYREIDDDEHHLLTTVVRLALDYIRARIPSDG